MKRIIQILIKNHVFFLFIILQLIAVQLLIKNHFIIESKFLSQVSNTRPRLCDINSMEVPYFLKRSFTNCKIFFPIKDNDKLPTIVINIIDISISKIVVNCHLFN